MRVNSWKFLGTFKLGSLQEKWQFVHSQKLIFVYVNRFKNLLKVFFSQRARHNNRRNTIHEFRVIYFSIAVCI